MIECPDMKSNVTKEEAKLILGRSKTVAVVGISHKADRDSHKVAKYLKEHGYRIIPVNPKYRDVLGEKCYPDLKAVPEHIDVVDIFRNVEMIPGIVDEAVAVGADAVWMQRGLLHEKAAERARSAGLVVVMDECMMETHIRLNGGCRAGSSA